MEFDKFSLKILHVIVQLGYFPQTCSRALQSSHSCDWLSANSDQPITRRLRSEATPQWTTMQRVVYRNATRQYYYY